MTVPPAAVQVIAGVPFEDYMRTAIFDRLGRPRAAPSSSRRPPPQFF